MFSNISWSEYLTFLSVSAFFWYAFVIYTYYRHDLFRRFQSDNATPHHSLNFTSTQPENRDHHASEFDLQSYQPKLPDAAFVMQSFTDEVQAFLSEAGKEEISNPDLLNSLSVIIKKYPSLIGSDYQEAMVSFIIEQVSETTGISLTDADLERIK